MTDTTQPVDWITDEAIQVIVETFADPDNDDLNGYVKTKFPRLLAILQQRNKAELKAFVDDLMREVAEFSSDFLIKDEDDFFTVLDTLYYHEVRPWLTKQAIGQLRQSLMQHQNKAQYDFIAEKEPEIIAALQTKDVEAMKKVVDRLEQKTCKPVIQESDVLRGWLIFWAKMKMKLGYDTVVETPRIVIDCQVEGVAAKALVDTGSQISAIKEEFVHRLKLPDYLWDRSVKFGVSGVGQGSGVGLVHGLDVKISGRCFPTNFLVIIAPAKEDLILGIDFLAFNRCQIYCEDYSVLFVEKKFWVIGWPSEQLWEYCRWRDFGLRKKREIQKQSTGGGIPSEVLSEDNIEKGRKRGI